ncbi:hypothetical protein B566_EDAN013292 [Ephemera danica]|nr:hypothetical protein B566_EDAN013292 [Ephemera danica]
MIPQIGVSNVYYPSWPSAARVQYQFPAHARLPCDYAQRSASSPTSVHRLRPGDIDVVAALGDSLIAGNGAMEEYAAGTFFEHRGVSWCAGGQATWRQFMTLPNILKEFNPRLRGYSTGQGEYHAPNSRLNVAFPVAADENLLQQARILVARMRKDPSIDIANHWKLVTILIGANDLCSSQCFNSTANTGEQHALQLRRALDYLQRHLPRTLVSLVSVPDVLISRRVETTFMCRLLHRLFCRCYHRGQTPADIWRLVREYQAAEEQLALSGLYDTRPDFTVVFQPFMQVLNAPWSEASSGQFKLAPIDQTFVTFDCFHFSQKGHAMMANLYWNNLLEPVGNKTRDSKDGRERSLQKLLHRFVCPTQRTPYIFTNENSERFFRTGHQ